MLPAKYELVDIPEDGNGRERGKWKGLFADLSKSGKAASVPLNGLSPENMRNRLTAASKGYGARILTRLSNDRQSLIVWINPEQSTN